MKKLAYISIFILSAAWLMMLCGFKPDHTMAGTSLCIIINKDNPVNSLTAGEVKLYWLRKIKTRWPEINKNIHPVDRKQKCAEQSTFYSKLIGMGNDDVETYFMTKQYQNAQKPQEKFNSDREIIDYVADEIGAIGFVNAGSMTAEARSKVKVVFTLGE